MLREHLKDALKTATANEDRAAIAIVRLVHAALKERDQQARADGEVGGLTDDELVEMLQTMVQQRCDSIRKYEEAGQLDLAQQERDEIAVIERFLPAQLDDQACARVVHDVISELGASKLKDAGRVMTTLKSRYPGQMDFPRVRRLICRELD
jgi:uncharacterized protein YqeY